MSFEADYPNAAKWVLTGGTLSIQTAGEAGKMLLVEIAIGDAGGVPEGCTFKAPTVHEAMAEVEARLGCWIESNRELYNELLTGELQDTEYEYLIVAGHPPIKNPYFKGK